MQGQKNFAGGHGSLTLPATAASGSLVKQPLLK